MVPRAGLEPAQSCDHEILSLARIPISPPRLKLPACPPRQAENIENGLGVKVTVTKPVSVTGNG
jgi:hypothetical protein